jgi:hypothetical protein
MPQQQRPAEMQEAQQQQKQQQKAQASRKNFECGKPNMPCGSAIPEGKKCEKGPGWCEPGYFCGFETTTAEPSKCLPIPKDCGKAGNPCCPSNKGAHTAVGLWAPHCCKVGCVPEHKGGGTLMLHAASPYITSVLVVCHIFVP